MAVSEPEVIVNSRCSSSVLRTALKSSVSWASVNIAYFCVLFLHTFNHLGFTSPSEAVVDTSSRSWSLVTLASMYSSSFTSGILPRRSSCLTEEIDSSRVLFWIRVACCHPLHTCIMLQWTFWFSWTPFLLKCFGALLGWLISSSPWSLRTGSSWSLRVNPVAGVAVMLIVLLLASFQLSSTSSKAHPSNVPMSVSSASGSHRSWPSSTWWMLFLPYLPRHAVFLLRSPALCPTSAHQSQFPLNPSLPPVHPLPFFRLRLPLLFPSPSVVFQK